MISNTALLITMSQTGEYLQNEILTIKSKTSSHISPVVQMEDFLPTQRSRRPPIFIVLYPASPISTLTKINHYRMKKNKVDNFLK